MTRINSTALISFLCFFSMNAQYSATNSDSLATSKYSFNHQMKWNTIGVASAFTVALLLDEPVKYFVEGHQSDGMDDITDVTNVFGEKTIMIPALAATLGAGYIFKDDKLTRTSWNAVKAVATTAIATEILKYSTGRARPFMGEGAYSFDPFNGADEYKSMPSGHVSLAFAIFTPFAESYSRWLYLVPATVLYSRIYKNKHWFSDAVLGGGLGFLSGYFFTHHPRKKIQFFGNGMVIYF
ncbi:phosphatase PAP2 family protein [Marinilabiliaceae bacterium JC017]|nr:phosphatase PAP2 family protein [Marinilabiliaceae bacterium JC017]